MAMSKSLVNYLGNRKTPAIEIIIALDELISVQLKKQLIMTLGLVEIDPGTHQIAYFNCGHPFPFHRRSNGKHEEIECVGPPLGYFRKNMLKRPANPRLEPGERIVLFTDGPFEAMQRPHSAISGYDLFREYLDGRPALPLEESCRDALDQHPFLTTGAPLPDDFTVVMIERAYHLNNSGKA